MDPFWYRLVVCYLLIGSDLEIAPAPQVPLEEIHTCKFRLDGKCENYV
jgi:hypothetical protein